MKLWPFVSSCFFPSHKSSESNGHHQQFGNVVSKFSGGTGFLPDLTQNLFVGYIPVQVTLIVK